MSRFYKHAREYVHTYVDTSKWSDVAVPDQALSVRELLDRYKRENKPLPDPVDYDVEALEMEYRDLVIPTSLTRADALHLMDLTKAHMNKLEYELRKKSESAPEGVTPPSGTDSPKPYEGAE